VPAPTEAVAAVVAAVNRGATHAEPRRR